MALGILVEGDNHFIVRGPVPDAGTALALAHHWSLIQIGSTTPIELRPWQISTSELRENLQWAFVIGDAGPSPTVAQLLQELAARSVKIQFARTLFH